VASRGVDRAALPFGSAAGRVHAPAVGAPRKSSYSIVIAPSAPCRSRSTVSLGSGNRRFTCAAVGRSSG